MASTKFQALLVVVILIQHVQQGNAGDVVQRFGLCEGQRGFIQCTDGYRIKIISAVYGRTSKDLCPTGNSRGGNCRSHISNNKVKWNCNGYSICHLHANKAWFGDPCPGQAKYLSVNYHCVQSAADCGKGLSETVAFAAFISKTFQVHRNTFLNVVFDTVDFNAGNAYNTHDGFFTAPSDGLYVFTWAFLVEPNRIFDSHIQVNGKNRGLSNCNNVTGKGILPCSNTTPLLLKKSDRVNIRKRHGDKVYGNKWCSFKGWKVY